MPSRTTRSGDSSFPSSYLAGTAALSLLAALVGLTLTGERHSGLVGAVEVEVLVVGALLFVGAGLGTRFATRSPWPALAAGAAVVLVATLVFLTATGPDAGSAVLLELAALVIGLLLVADLRRA